MIELSGINIGWSFELTDFIINAAYQQIDAIAWFARQIKKQDSIHNNLSHSHLVLIQVLPTTQYTCKHHGTHDQHKTLIPRNSDHHKLTHIPEENLQQSPSKPGEGTMRA